MATTATEKTLLIGGEWVETGEWQEVRSPYSGEVVGRVSAARIFDALARLYAHRATHDELTGLANRSSLLDRLSTACADGERVTLAYVDLDLDPPAGQKVDAVTISVAIGLPN